MEGDSDASALLSVLVADMLYWVLLFFFTLVCSTFFDWSTDSHCLLASFLAFVFSSLSLLSHRFWKCLSPQPGAGHGFSYFFPLALFVVNSQT